MRLRNFNVGKKITLLTIYIEIFESLLKSDVYYN